MKDNNIIQEKSYNFELRIIKLCRYMKKHKEFELAGQILRSGTGIGANVEEALAGMSRSDFSAKMNITTKEARETFYWLRLVRDSDIINKSKITPLIDEADELRKILTAIVKTSRFNDMH